MLKKFLTILYAVILITYMTACAAPKPQEKVEEPDIEEEETVEEDVEETEETAEADGATTTDTGATKEAASTTTTAPAAQKAEAPVGQQPETAKPQ